MKIICFNCNSRTKYKIPSFVIDTIIKKEPDVAILTEVIPSFNDNDYNRFTKDYKIACSIFEKGKNSIIIAVRSHDELSIERVNSVANGFKQDELAPNFLNVIVKEKDKIFNIIGFRMLTSEMDYDFERKLFNTFFDNNNEIINPDSPKLITVLAGDFNNAKHFGSLNRSFDDVEDKYWTQNWNEKTLRYEGDKFRRAHYNYNLHIIQDKLLEKGLRMVEGEDDYSFIDKYGNKIHDDHLFISDSFADKTVVKFQKENEFLSQGKTNGLDHRYFICTIELD